VLTDRGIQMKRICDRDGITPEQAKQRLDNQLSNDFLVSKVDFVIHNDKDREHLASECDQMLEAVKQSDIKRKEIL
jgi:dephospho-CoA kinase